MEDPTIISDNTSLCYTDLLSYDNVVEDLNGRFSNITTVQCTKFPSSNNSDDGIKDLTTRLNNTVVNYVELSPEGNDDENGSGYKINETPVFESKLRLHVKFGDRYYGKSPACRWTKFADSDLKIPKIKGYQLLTVDDGKKPSVIYLAKSWKLRSAIEQIPVEVNVCSCVLSSTKQPHGGVIIVGEKDKLEQLVEKQLPYHVDTVDQLLVVPINQLFGVKMYKNYKLHFILREVVTKLRNKQHLHIVVGVVVKDDMLTLSHGKRHPFETTKECAVRELREEFALELELSDTSVNLNKMRLYFSC
jgi:hypothetical protein